MKAFLALEDGTVFEGVSAGAEGTAIGEIVFNTSMTGYQEAITNPEYYGQILTMTYPLIGNYGINDEDNESDRVHIRGLIVRELCKNPSNWRMNRTLESCLKKNNIVAIEGVDTRRLTEIIREKGVMNGMIATEPEFDINVYIDQIKAYKVKNAVNSVTCEKPYEQKAEDEKYRVALLDLGVIRSFVKTLESLGCTVAVFPAHTLPDEIIKGGFDGIILSGGPGNPKECTGIIENTKVLLDKSVPILGIGLGHQIIALANGLDTEKMRHGHRGANQPVTYKEKNATLITSQNHGYVVLPDIENTNAQITHYNLNDNTVEGIRYKGAPVLSVQYYPDESDTGGLLADFISLMEVRKNA